MVIRVVVVLLTVVVGTVVVVVVVVVVFSWGHDIVNCAMVLCNL